jgi:hypothetical protein
MRVDLAKPWVIEVFVIAGAIHANTQQQKGALCTPTGTASTTTAQECFTGTLAHILFPWLVGGALLIGTFTPIGTLLHVLRR